MTTAEQATSTTPLSEREWLTPNQVDEYTPKNITTIYLALQSGELHGHQKGKNGRWTVLRLSVDAWIKNQDTREPCCPGTVTPLRRSRRKTKA